MRFFRVFLKAICPWAAVLALPFLSSAGVAPQNVVLEYHFVGATQLADDPYLSAAERIFARPDTAHYQDLVLNLLSTNLAKALDLQADPKAPALLRPLLDDVVRSESVGYMGGANGKRINYVFAFRLSDERTQLWEKNLKAVLHGTAEPIQDGKYAGWEWNRGTTDSFWIMTARDWFFVGQGAELEAIRHPALMEIQELGELGPEIGTNCFAATIDWPGMANWFPALNACPLKLGRTEIVIDTETGGFHLAGKVKYPEAIEWQQHPMLFPTNLVREPLLSFATGQNIEPFLKSDETLSHLCTDPFRDQFYFWSMNQIAFQSYVAWPAQNPSNVMATLAPQVLKALNPQLESFDGTRLGWYPKIPQLVWAKRPLIAPVVQVPPATNGPFLAAGIFPLTPGQSPAPGGLWEQIQGRKDLVYYDWEFTGPRLRHLITVSQVLPIMEALGIGPTPPRSAAGTNAPIAIKPGTLMDVQEHWLGNLAPFLANTVTEVTKTGPDEVMVVRTSPFVFSSLEILLLSHWLTDTPAGKLDWDLLPEAPMYRGGVPVRVQH